MRIFAGLRRSKGVFAKLRGVEDLCGIEDLITSLFASFFDILKSWTVALNKSCACSVSY